MLKGGWLVRGQHGNLVSFFLAVLQGFIEMEDIQASMAVLKYYTQVAPCIR